MEVKLRAYLASVLLDLKLGKNLPVLNFQFRQLVKALVNELHSNGQEVDKLIVESYLVNLFRLEMTTDNNDVMTEALSKYNISSIIDSVMI